MTLVHELDLPEIDIFGLDRTSLVHAFEAASKRHWLARTPLGYAVSRHEDVTAILRDQRFHSALSLLPQLGGVPEGRLRNRQERSILSKEGDEHNRLRRLASPAFTPKATERLRPFMRRVINDLVDGFADTSRCELVHDVCEPYPIPIICELLGAPKDDWRLFSAWATDIFRMFNNDLANDLDAIEGAMEHLDAYVRHMIDERRGRPADDLLTRLIQVEEEGDRLSTDELVMMAEAVLMAGTDTTRNQLACAVALFAEHPSQWAALGADPELAARAVEEAMRHLGTVRGTARIVAEDAEHRGVTFPAGTLVMLSLVAANHDAEVWTDPSTFDIQRPSGGAPQLTFGSGLHYCLGASLARAELQEALPILARRMPDLSLVEAIQWKPPTVGIWGPSRLALAFGSPGSPSS
ncbi:MAG TPA: cytochrome P450 [Acidimicrobiales bacterium]|jgi:cytochrome P450|nr:cytochrome P450 [Acidimicrobiales bacterium]